MKTTAEIVCPYCKHPFKQAIEITSTTSNMEVYHCDLDTGGCDKPFVAKYKVNVAFETMEIVGQKDTDTTKE